MVEKLFHRRLVARRSLADLETQVRELQSSVQRWDLDRDAESITLVDAFDQLADKRIGQIAIAMKRELTSEEYAALPRPHTSGVEGGGTG